MAPALAVMPAAFAPPHAQGAGGTPARSHAPETLHPALWRAHQVGRAAHAVWASGFAELDRQLPGGGWPAGTLTALLLPHPGVGELRLLAPVLVGLQAQQRSVMWFDPPAAPCPWALGALGLDMLQQVIVQSRAVRPAGVQAAGSVAGSASAQGAASAHAAHGAASAHAAHGAASAYPPAGASPAFRHGLQAKPGTRVPAADILWALEQALKSGQVGAVLAWLPARLPADALRRLQLAAQSHEGPVFLLRAAEERSRASAAPLRLLLSAWGPDLLRVSIVKRRGAPLAEPLMLELPPVLSAPALARALRGPARHAVWAMGEGAVAQGPAAEAGAAEAAAAESGEAESAVASGTAAGLAADVDGSAAAAHVAAHVAAHGKAQGLGLNGANPPGAAWGGPSSAPSGPGRMAL